MENVILIQGDCVTLMKEIPDKSVDMVLCDLPYGVTKNKWDTTLDINSVWESYNRIVKDDGVIALFCDGLFMATLMLSQRDIWRYNLVWKKQQGCDFLNANRKPLKAHKEIAIFYKKQPTFNKQYWYSNPYQKTLSGSRSNNYGYYNPLVSCSDDGKRNPLTVLEFGYDKAKLHPTQKPVALCEWLIKTYTNEGETVLDNCMGSGSTGVACMNTDRKFVGIELDCNYFKMASERIENVRFIQGNLWVF